MAVPSASAGGWGGVGCVGGAEACSGFTAAWGDGGEGLRPACCDGGWQAFLVLRAAQCTLSLGQSPCRKVAPGPEQLGQPWHQWGLPVRAKQPLGSGVASALGTHGYIGHYWQ